MATIFLPVTGSTSFDVIHSLYPFELVLFFELFNDTFGFCHLFNQPREHFLCLGVDFGKVRKQRAGHKHYVGFYAFVVFEIVTVSNTPSADGLAVFG